MAPFNFALIPGCTMWVEVDLNPETNLLEAINKLKQFTGAPGEVFIWEDPNNDGRGVVVAYDRELTEEERAAIERGLAARFQPPLSDLPTG